mmetsp:Transcript_28336/g.111261  ORF Transcript_28336/g.111261 Transcript_28336/m.111261 type:complete len:83 (-) Transcript_28336:662-910(-)
MFNNQSSEDRRDQQGLYVHHITVVKRESNKMRAVRQNLRIAKSGCNVQRQIVILVHFYEILNLHQLSRVNQKAQKTSVRYSG